MDVQTEKENKGLNLKKCILICASPKSDIEFISRDMPQKAFVICVDGGLAMALNIGIRPDLVVGDFDSYPLYQFSACETIRLPTHKDDTDTMYAVKTALNRGFDDFYIYGATGGREDHTFANICILKFLADRGCQARISDPYTKITCQNTGMRLYRNQYDYFSIFPFGCLQSIVSLKGFEYPLERGTLTCSYPLGISNTIVGETGEITVHDGCIVVMQINENERIKMKPCAY